MTNLIPQALAQVEIINPALPETTRYLSSGRGLAFYIASLWRTTVTVGGIAFLLYLVWGGFEWLQAGGDKTKLETAQHKITNALIGLTIRIGSCAITRFIEFVFKIDLLNPVFPSNL